MLRLWGDELTLICDILLCLCAIYPIAMYLVVLMFIFRGDLLYDANLRENFARS